MHVQWSKLSFIISILFKNVPCLINPHGPTIAAEYTDCMAELITTNFRDSGLLIFGNTNNMSTSVWRIRAELLQIVHGYNKYFVEIVTPTGGNAICTSHEENLSPGRVTQKDAYSTAPNGNYYVIIVDSFVEFTKVTSKIVRSSNWNPGARFLILLFDVNPSSSREEKVREAENILQCLYKWNVIRSAVVIPDAHNLRNALIYGWKALDPTRYCGYTNETTAGRVTIQTVCDKGKLRHKTLLFENAVPSNMMGCQLKILALERQPFVSKNIYGPNIERHFVTELVKWFNYTPNIQIVNYSRGELSPELEWEGALNKIVQRKGDILFGAIFPDDEVHRDFDCSTTYLADSYTWVVARAERVPAWMSPIITFKKKVWYLAIGGFFVSVFTWMFLGRLSEETIYHRSFCHCFLNAFVSNLGFCAYARPVKESLRVFFCYFSIYCIVFVTAFQTKLIDVLTNPSFSYQITTVEELLSSGIRFGGFEELHDLFYNSSDPLDKHIGDLWLDIDDIHQAMLDVVVHRNFSLLCSRLEIEHLSSTIPGLTDSFGNLKYYAFEDNVFTVSVEMVALQGFPFIEEFSLMIGKYKQLGATEKLRQRFHDSTRQRRGVLLDNLDEDDPDVKPLSLLHLQGGFMVLALGYLCGFIALLVEVFLNSNFAKEKIKIMKFAVKLKMKKRE